MNTAALLDAWIVPALLAEVGRPIAHVDVHAFAYLAQVAGVLEEPARLSGGYAYFATAQGSPFAPALEDALQKLKRRGAFATETDGRLLPIESVPEWLLGSEIATQRLRYLHASADAALYFHVGQVRQALRESPGLRTSLSSPTAARELLSDGHAEVLKRQARALDEALEGHGSLSRRVALYIVALLRSADGRRAQGRAHVS